MSGDAGDIEDQPPPSSSIAGMTACMQATMPKKLGLEKFAADRHLHFGNRVAHADASVPSTQTSTRSNWRDHPQGAVDLLADADVAGQGEGAIGVADPMAGGLGAARIARKQYDAGAVAGEDFGDGFSDAHEGAGDDHDFPFHCHGEPCGRLDILTRGVERFEVLQVNEERSFLQAEIAVVEDEPGRPAAHLVEQAVRLHAEIVKLAGNQADGPEEHTDRLSFLLAGSLPLDLDFKQKLLSTLSEAKRLEAVVEYLQAVLPGLRSRCEGAMELSGGPAIPSGFDLWDGSLPWFESHSPQRTR